MSLLQKFSTFSIKKKIRTIIFAFLAIQVILTAFMVLNAITIQRDMKFASEVKSDLVNIKTLKEDVIGITLVAMDSIVDKDEGKISAERFAELQSISNDAQEKIKSSIKAALNRQPINGVTANDIQQDTDKLASYITTDLNNAITSRAAPEEFARLDDLIDESGTKLNEKITKVEESVTSEMTATFDRTAFQANVLLGYVLVQFLITWALLQGMTKFINCQIVEPLTVQINQTLDGIRSASLDLKQVTVALTSTASKTEQHSSLGGFRQSPSIRKCSKCCLGI